MDAIPGNPRSRSMVEYQPKLVIRRLNTTATFKLKFAVDSAC